MLRLGLVACTCSNISFGMITGVLFSYKHFGNTQSFSAWAGVSICFLSVYLADKAFLSVYSCVYQTEAMQDICGG